MKCIFFLFIIFFAFLYGCKIRPGDIGENGLEKTQKNDILQDTMLKKELVTNLQNQIAQIDQVTEILKPYYNLNTQIKFKPQKSPTKILCIEPPAPLDPPSYLDYDIDKQTKIVNGFERIFLPVSPISNLIEKIKPKEQIFQIEAHRDTILISKSGTTFAVSANSFINQKGKSPHLVEITLLEVNTISDIIATNLQTTANEKILQTGGMFFLDAKEGESSLELVKGKSIYVDYKSNYKGTNMKVFEGSFDSSGINNWVEKGALDNKLITLPLKMFDFGVGGLECALSKEQIDLLQNHKLQNTYIATREFEERTMRVLNYAACPQYQDLSQKLLEFYTNNVGQDLYYADSLATDYLYKTYKKKIDTTIKFAFDERGWLSYFYRTLVGFKTQKLGQVIDFNKYKVTGQSTVVSLIEKGCSENDAIALINYYKTQQELIVYRTNANQTIKLVSYSFSLTKLGWSNVDQFMEGEKMGHSDITVKTISNELLGFVSVSLVIPSYNVSIFSIQQDGDNYSFTKKVDGYRQLPIGEEAIVVAIAYKNNQPYFGKEKIIIKKSGTINLTMTPISEALLKKEIANITEK